MQKEPTTMKPSITLALALAAVPVVASADYIERYYTSDGRLVERRYVDAPRYVERPYYYGSAYNDRYYRPNAPEPYYYAPGPISGDAAAVHTGGDSAADQALAARIGDAMTGDRMLDGVTATVTARDGEVTISGSADRSGQSDRAQQIAKRFAGWNHVSGTLEVRGGN